MRRGKRAIRCWEPTHTASAKLSFSRKIRCGLLLAQNIQALALALAPSQAQGANAIRQPLPHASAFFGTSLASTLRAMGVDTVVIAGVSTSGCIRASATDALTPNTKSRT